MRQLEPTGARVNRAGECSLAVAEQLGFGKPLRDGLPR